MVELKGHHAIAVGKLALYEGGRRGIKLSKEVKAEVEKALAAARAVTLAIIGVGRNPTARGGAPFAQMHAAVRVLLGEKQK